MKKKIRLTESNLRTLIETSVRGVLKEYSYYYGKNSYAGAKEVKPIAIPYRDIEKEFTRNFPELIDIDPYINEIQFGRTILEMITRNYLVFVEGKFDENGTCIDVTSLPSTLGLQRLVTKTFKEALKGDDWKLRGLTAKIYDDMNDFFKDWFNKHIDSFDKVKNGSYYEYMA